MAKPSRHDVDVRAGGITMVAVGGPPDWEMWQSMPTARLWEAVALSLGVDPVEAARDAYLPQHCSDYPKRLRIAEAHLAAGTALRLVSGALDTPTATVRLPEFGAWARSVGWALPAAFPCSAQKAEPAPTKETSQAQRARRLDRLRELDGDMTKAGDAWHVAGKRGALQSLVDEEKAAGRPMAQRQDVSRDLAAAMAEQEQT